MKAYRLVKFGQDLRCVDVPVPEPADHEVLVQLRASGTCRLDIPVRKGIRKAKLRSIRTGVYGHVFDFETKQPIATAQIGWSLGEQQEIVGDEVYRAY